MTVLDERGQPRRVTKHDSLRGTDLERGQGGGPAPISVSPTSSTTCPRGTVASGADYRCGTYAVSLAKARWTRSYPLDHVGEHQYLDQGGLADADNIKRHLREVRAALVHYEETTTIEKSHMTEGGWTTAAVTENDQAESLRRACDTYNPAESDIHFVGRAYGFNVRDIPEADLYYGPARGEHTTETPLKKLSFEAFGTYAKY